MQHQRFMFPVGQGGFAFENIDGVSVIYDCGSDTSPKRVEMYIDMMVKNGFKTVDYLFISHFDRDHVNCLEYLVNNINVSNAVAANIRHDRRIVYNAITYGAYNRIMALFQNIDGKVIEVEEGADFRPDIPTCPLGEWIARSMFVANDWNVFDSALAHFGLDMNRLQEPGYVAANRKRIANCFKSAFGVSSVNAKGLIMMSHKAAAANVQSMRLKWKAMTLPTNIFNTGALYVGDACLLGRHTQLAEDLLRRTETNGLLLMQVPHHGSHNNSDQSLVSTFPSQYYFVCNKDDVRICNNSLWNSIQQRALLVHDLDSEIVEGMIEVV